MKLGMFAARPPFYLGIEDDEKVWGWRSYPCYLACHRVLAAFGARIITGGLCGTALGASGGTLIGGLVAGVIGPSPELSAATSSGQGWWQGPAAGIFQSHSLRTRLRSGRDSDCDVILMIKTFDAIVIGAGQAGPSLAGRLTGAGMSVALIERKLIGGTCVNVASESIRIAMHIFFTCTMCFVNKSPIRRRCRG
jgi:hypothetical protein